MTYTETALIRCASVSVKYDTGFAVKDVSFGIMPGDYLCVVGENGSGKTSLMKAIAGLVPLASGSVHLNGIESNQVGYLPQQTPAQKDFPASVREVVLSGRLGRNGKSPFYTKQDKQIADEKISMLNIGAVKKKSYRSLSGGQQQRVLLARALCATERLLLLDEPVTGLDPLMSAEMYEILRGLNERGMTIVMVSHDVGVALHHCNKVLHMQTSGTFFESNEAYLSSEVGRYFLGRDENV
jgi:zinc transport system ATP-binding protein